MKKVKSKRENGIVVGMVGRVAAILIAIIALFPRLSQGYGIESESSLEWNLANADRVVHGRVTALRYEVRHGNFKFGLAKDLWRVQTVRVTETLKGPPAEELTIARPWLDDDRPAAPDSWDHLFCVVSSQRIFWEEDWPKIKNFYPWFAFDDQYGLDYVLDLDAPEHASGPQYREHLAMTADMRMLTRGKDVLDVARRYCSAAPAQRPTSFELQADLPGDLQGLAHLGYYLTVPLDSWTENLARQQLQNRDGVRRSIAIKILANFQNPQNVSLLSAMLSDPATVRVEHDYFPFPYHHPSRPESSQFYYVRSAAAQVLSDWGIKTPTMVVTRPQADYARISRRDLAALLTGIPATLILLHLVCRMLMRRGRFAVTCLIASVGFIAALVAMSSRSIFCGDEIIYTRSARYRLLSYDGALRFMRIADWPVAEPPLIGIFRFETPSATMVADRESEPALAWTNLIRTGDIAWNWGGFSASHGTTIDPTNALRPYQALVVPYRGLLLAAAFIATIVFSITTWRTAQFVRATVRRRRGLCTRCGYDLRASSQACPECGAAVPANAKHS